MVILVSMVVPVMVVTLVTRCVVPLLKWMVIGVQFICFWKSLNLGVNK